MKRFAYVTLIAATAVACTASPSVEPTEAQSHLEATAAACTPATQADVLANMAKQPILPPRHAAGLDLTGADDWSGPLRAAVDSQLCAGTEIGEFGGGEDGPAMVDVVYGGTKEAPILDVNYDKATGALKFISFLPGYTGGLDFKSRDGAHTYSIHVGQPIAKDGQPLSGTWNDAAGLTELADAMVATFAPDLPGLGADCVASHHCLNYHAPDDDQANPGAFAFGARDIGMYLFASPQGIASATPDYLYMFPHKPGATPPPPPAPTP